MTLHQDNDYRARVCKPGQRATTCSYLIVGADGYECAKDPGNESIKKILEARRITGTMTAQGENCAGYQAVTSK